MANFEEFMKSKRMAKNSDFTHTSFKGGKYYIQSEEYEEYLKLYQQDNGSSFGIVEFPKTIRYMRFDLDLHFSNNRHYKKYTAEQIYKIVKSIRTEISYYIPVNKKFTIYVLQRPQETEKGDIIKNGLHIQIPEITTKMDYITKVIRDNLISNELVIKTLEEMEVLNPINDVFDECIYEKNGWIQYGSDKGTDNSNAYKVKYYQKDDYLNDKSSLISPTTNDKINYTELFALRNKHKPIVLNDDAEKLVKQKCKEDNEKERQIIIATEKKKEMIEEAKAKRNYDDVVDKDFIKELVGILNPIRVDTYKSWSELGWCLKSIDEGLFELFDKLSQGSGKYDDIAVEKFWNNATQGNYTMGTLRFWAKQDNAEKYDEICEKYKKYNIENFNFRSDINHFNLAEVFVNEYNDKYIFNKNEIFVYHNDIWDNQISDALIQDDLVKMIGKLCKIATRTQDKEYIALILSNFSKISTRPNREKIVKDIKEKLLIKNNHNILINYTLDQKRNIHFRNGVLEMEKYNPEINNIEECFRPRKKTDYVSGYNDYDFNVDVCKEKIDKVRKIYEQIQPNKENFDYYLTFLAYCLTGDTKYQKCEIGVGYSASNGKSTHTEIHQISMPFYTMKLDKKTFNEGNSKNHKQFIELFNKPVRLSYMEELKTDKLDAELFKEYVDGKSLNVEVLYGSCKIHPIQAKLKTSSNFDLDIQNDKGVIRRGLKLNYESRFVDDEDKVVEDKHIYLADEDLIEKFEIDDDMKSAYIMMLLPYVSNYIKNGLIIPKKIKNAFKEMVEEYDDVGLLINNSDTFEKVSPNEIETKDRISKNEILNIFKNNGIKISWKQLLGQMKGYGYIWNRQKRNSQSTKGCFENLKYKGEIVNEDDEC